jgi:hypothetical protein
MRKKNSPKKSSESSLRILFLFCAMVVIAISLSLGYRLFNLMRDSKYDSNHNFLITFIYHNDIDFVEINSSQKTFSHLKVRGGSNLQDTKKEVGLLSDTDINLAKPFSINSLSDYFMDAAWHKNNVKSSLNIFDLYRLSFATKHITSQSISSQELHIPFDENLSGTMLEQLFLDESLDQENKTVSIVNAAGVPGLGTRLERTLSHIGINIISVKNADDIKSTSSIEYTGEKSYTLDRLEDLLSLPPSQSSSQSISDIIIIIGKDMNQTTKF